MKIIIAILSLSSIPLFGSEQKNLYLKIGGQGGFPLGLGISARAVAFLFNVEGGVSYGHFLNTVQMGMGLRIPIGDRNELFLNAGGNKVYSKNINLKVSGGPWMEIQHELSFGSNGFSIFAGIGLGVFPEDNELNIPYFVPTIKIGVSKAIFGY